MNEQPQPSPALIRGWKKWGEQNRVRMAAGQEQQAPDLLTRLRWRRYTKNMAKWTPPKGQAKIFAMPDAPGYEQPMARIKRIGY